MVELAPDVIEGALTGDPRAVRAFVDAMTPVIQSRAARALVRRAAGERRDLRQEVADMTQDVFAALFAHDARALRAWDPARGLSLANFVGLITSREVASIMRNGRRDPWRDVPGELDELDAVPDAKPDADPRIDSRRALERLLERMRESLSPRGLELFQRLYVDEEPIEEVAPALQMTREAIYAWRNRVGKLIRSFASELDEIRPLDPSGSRRTPLGTTDTDG